jgi:predicted site-specific integrase-resolvase
MTDKELPNAEGTLLDMPGVAARKLHVTTKTLQRMAARGDIAAIILPSGHRRYRAADVDALANADRPSEAAAS